eukprot:gb/GFBE01030621.1/.p1 GENE.gb/GFBE01030621.1/~~gb/GFBE01030621.1/.p1  ORF type:complete len:633 (+),score=117.47 gb/GFBE01030621.1/:1-1899(+)
MEGPPARGCMVLTSPCPVGLMTGTGGGCSTADSEQKASGAGAPWVTCSSTGEELVLPYWQEADEQPGHQSTVFGFHTEPCIDFQNGYCSLHRARGKMSLCFCFHFDSQQRRPPVDATTGQILYWDVPCHSMSTGSVCRDGKNCAFAHSREEISYHPAKYKTRRCNGKGCRGQAICCFAHDEVEMRACASEKYSYWASASGGRGRASSAGTTASGDWSEATTGASSYDDGRKLAPGIVHRHQLPAARRKTRFCASYPEISQCRRGAACEFAHSREEAATELLTLEQEQQAPDALTEDFFMYHFKTLWCPIGVQHDWQTCVYAHNYQDARRNVSIGYGPQPCPYWAKKDPNAEYGQRCPQGLRCPYAHGAKEQLYHPRYFRTVICRDLRTKACPREQLCAFFHRRTERRRPPSDDTDYNTPLKEEALPEAWVEDFLSPPFRDTPAGVPLPASEDYLSLIGTADFNSEGGAANPGAYWCSSLFGEQSSFFPSGTGAIELNELQDLQEPMWDQHQGLLAFLESLQEPPDVPLTLSALRLNLELQKEEARWELKEDTPRTQTGESDPADDCSTSTSREVPALGERVPGAGVVERQEKQQACYGPFGGPFGSFPGFLAIAAGEGPQPSVHKSSAQHVP